MEKPPRRTGRALLAVGRRLLPYVAVMTLIGIGTVSTLWVRHQMEARAKVGKDHGDRWHDGRVWREERKAWILAGLTYGRELRKRAEQECWPRRSSQIAAMEAWLADAQGEVGRLEAYAGALRDLEKGGKGTADLARSLGAHMEFLDQLSDPDPRIGLLTDVRQRLEVAKNLRTWTLVDHRDAWQEAVDGIQASDIYGGLRISPAIGLVPLGPDPVSGHWEFWLVESGERPRRGDEGSWILGPETGIILVLLPGGSVAMGAQDEDPSAENYDPHAEVDEGPVHELTLAPFLIGKYEVTQGQWVRLMNDNPAYYDAGHVLSGFDHPVESVSYYDAMQAVARLGLQLPTEAQWEYAARAGTNTPWWTGIEANTLEGKANLLDANTVRASPHLYWGMAEEWEDAFMAHAPVSRSGVNPFGLFGMHGNVWEWCRDRMAAYSDAEPGMEDGRRDDLQSSRRVYRGGSFGTNARSARSANRASADPAFRINRVGFRVCARVERGDR